MPAPRLVFHALTIAAAMVLAAPAPAQLTRLNFANQQTNLLADFSQVFWAPGPGAGEFFILAPISGPPATRYRFDMFNWNSHAMMQAWQPNGWYEVRFAFPQWAYLSTAPCAMQPAPGNTLPHGGIDSTWDYGPPLNTGPVLGLNLECCSMILRCCPAFC